MIDEVVVVGVRRARELVEMGEIKQAIGRAGRSYTKSGRAVILCPSTDAEYAEECLSRVTPPVKSELISLEEVSFHVLPWIDRVYDEDSFQKWYSRSLAAIQGNEMHWDAVSKYLLETGCINEEYALTDFGRISVRMYYSPCRLCHLREKLLEAEANGNATDLVTLSYVFASEHLTVSDVEAWELSEYKSTVLGNGYSFSGGELMHGFAYWCAMTGGIVPKWIRHAVSQIRDDLPRLFTAVEMIADSEGIPSLAERLRIAGIGAVRKVPVEIARIIDEFGLKQRSSALELHNMGIDTKDDLKRHVDDVLDNGSGALVRELQDNGFLKEANHRRLMDSKS